MTIWKYVLQITDEQTILMPDFAQILSVQPQVNPYGCYDPCLWVLVDPVHPMMPRIIRIYGTRNPIERPVGRFIGTVQMRKRVWHVFEK